MKILDKNEQIEYADKCQYNNCDNYAIGLVYDRETGQPQFYCGGHIKEIIEKGNPEYVEYCPNCGCGFGVN